MEKTQEMVGAYTPYSSKISNEELNVFINATKEILGVHYTPVAVASQVVSGVNYRFFCNAKDVYPNAINEAALIEIYKPLDGAARICEIKRC
ncbi:hypothetical protein GCQ56_13605 [Marinifilum sp. N1E240]|uniref:hypothetical protein n=1 Tax=Marinifilum sp. N1E240 TaxID=2608082 RepID=UPI00128E495F|nr:hypothetical protein [Marinifilum sp. N1E240]MPQ48037.1 hypothetical protein [Marinifilum sp. N1E240]